MIKRITKQIETPINLVDYVIEQLGDIGGGGSSQQYIDGEVEYHENLPTGIGNPATNTAYLVRKGQGVWLINRKPAGIWVRETDIGNLNDWVYAGSFPDVYNDANFRIYDNDDSSKNLAFNLNDLNSNTTVTLTIPPSGGTVITSNDTGVFYPRSNPSGFITGIAGLDLSSYVTGSVVRPGETGNFYTNNNPSGYISNTNLQKLKIPLQTGIEIYTGTFNTAFNSIPTVVATIEATGLFNYVTTLVNVTTTGFVTDFSDIIGESGVTLNIIAYN